MLPGVHFGNSTQSVPGRTAGCVWVTAFIRGPDAGPARLHRTHHTRPGCSGHLRAPRLALRAPSAHGAPHERQPGAQRRQGVSRLGTGRGGEEEPGRDEGG